MRQRLTGVRWRASAAAAEVRGAPRAQRQGAEEQSGGMPKPAKRLRSIGRYGEELVDGTLRCVSQRDEPVYDWPHKRRLAHGR
jgi:hypothetical protein